MCCNIRTHLIIVSSIGYFLTVLAGLEMRYKFEPFLTEIDIAQRVIFGGTLGLSAELKTLVGTIFVISELLCLIGAIKKKRILIVPFILCSSMQIIAGLLFTAYFGFSRGFKFAEISDALLLDCNSFKMLVLLLCIRQVMAVYFVFIALSYYIKEPSQGVSEGSSETVSDTCTSPGKSAAGEEFSSNYADNLAWWN